MNNKTKLVISFGSIIIIGCTISLNKVLANSIVNINEAESPNVEKEDSVQASAQKASKELALLISYKNDENLILCNKTTLLPDDYVPKNIVESNLPFLSYIETTKLNKTVASEAKVMFDTAKNDGINLLGASGYRSHQVQINLFNSRVNAVGKEQALKYSAPPGGSEHETGYAIDILSSDYSRLDSGFENTKAFKWLNENAHKYGFILRYPKDKEKITQYNYEPWHYRYVGKNHAKLIKENKLTLEEYLNEINKKIDVLQLSLNGE